MEPEPVAEPETETEPESKSESKSKSEAKNRSNIQKKKRSDVAIGSTCPEKQQQQQWKNRKTYIKKNIKN